MSGRTVTCPSCDYTARVRARPGKTKLTCPKCQTDFSIWA